jgi:hypothetical protein
MLAGVKNSSNRMESCRYRDSNPGPIFAIPGFGIKTFLIPGSRWDYVMTIEVEPLPRISHRPQFTHTNQLGMVWEETWHC